MPRNNETCTVASYNVSTLSQFQHSPIVNHWESTQKK